MTPEEIEIYRNFQKRMQESSSHKKNKLSTNEEVTTMLESDIKLFQFKKDESNSQFIKQAKNEDFHNLLNRTATDKALYISGSALFSEFMPQKREDNTSSFLKNVPPINVT